MKKLEAEWVNLNHDIASPEEKMAAGKFFRQQLRSKVTQNLNGTFQLDDGGWLFSGFTSPPGSEDRVQSLRFTRMRLLSLYGYAWQATVMSARYPGVTGWQETIQEIACGIGNILIKASLTDIPGQEMLASVIAVTEAGKAGGDPWNAIIAAHEKELRDHEATAAMEQAFSESETE